MLATKLLSMFLKDNLDANGVPQVNAFCARVADEIACLYIRRDHFPEILNGRVVFKQDIEEALGTDILFAMSKFLEER
jgi:hypothetical protein